MKPVFRDPNLENLFERGAVRTLARGEWLFHQGEPATAIFFIVRGRLRMVRHLASGDRITIHTGRTGELFAEGALFSDHYQCDTVADERTQVRSCPKTELLAAISCSPQSMLALLERVTDLLHNGRAMLELRNIRSAEERILQHLRLSVPRDHPSDGVLFDRPLLEIAEDLGMTREAYYRALAALKRDGKIERSGRRIVPLSQG
jgi:CRP-like cAMP-binding protein